MDQWLIIRKDICRKPRRQNILHVIAKNPGISFAGIMEAYNDPAAGVDDKISTGSLHEHLDFLVSGDYVTRKSTCPASFAIALDTVAFLKLGEICKKLKSDHAAKKAKQIKEELQKLGYSDA